MNDRVERESLLLPILIPIGALVAIVTVLFAFSRVLLSIKPSAATAVALVAAVGVLGIAAFVASRKQVTGAALGGFVGAAAGIAMLAGGIAIAVIGPPAREVEPFRASLSAPEGAASKGFAPDALEVEVNVPIELEFDNQDPGVGHNVEVFDGPDDSAPVVLKGEVITGPATTTYTIPGLSPGEYFFHCRIHPTTMTGTMTAIKGAGGVRVVAQNTAFNVDEIKLRADAPAPLTFENKDPFAHNLAIYRDESASGDPLFTLEPFPGPDTKSFTVPPIPAGEYYFHCDIHPVMNGTVIVAKGPPPEGGPPGDGGEGAPPGGPGEGGADAAGGG
jgi:plastocyanin